MTPTLRRALAAALFAIAPVAAVVVWLAVRSDLPHPMATHWKLNGEPNGFEAPGSFAALMITVSAALALVGGSMVTVDTFRPRGPLAGVFAWTSWVFAGGLVDALLSAHGAADAHSVHSGWTHSVPVVGVSLVVGLVVWWLTPLRQSSIGAETLSAPSFELAPGERAVWVGSTSSVAMLRIGAVVTAVGTVALVAVALLNAFGAMSSATPTDSSVLLTAAVLVLVGLAALWCHSVTVRVDATGVTARLSGTPWPRFRFRMSEIEAARAENIQPMQWGGWGYRLGGRRGSAIVIRKGPGIVLARRGRSDFAITVDDAESAAELVNALVSARAT